VIGVDPGRTDCGSTAVHDTSIPDGQCALVDPARGFATPTPTENINSQRRAWGLPDKPAKPRRRLRVHHFGKRRHMRFPMKMYHASYVSEA
jgi:hypothetical protein